MKGTQGTCGSTRPALGPGSGTRRRGPGPWGGHYTLLAASGEVWWLLGLPGLGLGLVLRARVRNTTEQGAEGRAQGQEHDGRGPGPGSGTRADTREHDGEGPAQGQEHDGEGRVRSGPGSGTRRRRAREHDGEGRAQGQEHDGAEPGNTTARSGPRPGKHHGEGQRDPPGRARRLNQLCDSMRQPIRHEVVSCSLCS